MNIAYVSLLPADDVHSWSGLNYNIAECLRRQGATVTLLGPFQNSRRVFWHKLNVSLRRATTSKRHLWTRQTSLLKFYGKKVHERLNSSDYDLVLSPGTEPIAYLPAGTPPVAFWTDAPFGAMLDYYPWYQNLAPSSIAEGMDCDTRALKRSSLGIYSSEWAADHARTMHHAPAARVSVVPFGANLACSLDADELQSLIPRRLNAPWRLLFVGVEWERKGGDIVLATAQELNRRGFPTELIIVGCQPPKRVYPLPDYVKVEGFINKRTEAGQKRLGELYRSALFFCMPSAAEAYGVVFCEANLHGVPCLATATGGIPTIIRNGSNGQLFPPGTPIEKFVTYIVEASRPATYAALAQGALQASRERLNWDAAGKAVGTLLEGVVSRNAATATPSLSRIGR